MSKESNGFYDAVATDYNRLLQSQDFNIKVRQRVAQYFLGNVPQKNVLDFGGGTGLDLPWLLDGGYSIYFYEPSVGMRDEAKKYLSTWNNPSVTILENQGEALVHSETFKQSIPLFSGVLANFAVLNHIPSLEKTFQQLGQWMEKDGSIIALVLAPPKPKNFVQLVVHKLNSFLFTNSQTHKEARYKNHTYQAYVHSMESLAVSYKNLFTLVYSEDLPEAGFILIHLKKL